MVFQELSELKKKIKYGLIVKKKLKHLDMSPLATAKEFNKKSLTKIFELQIVDYKF